MTENKAVYKRFLPITESEGHPFDRQPEFRKTRSTVNSMSTVIKSAETVNFDMRNVFNSTGEITEALVAFNVPKYMMRRRHVEVSYAETHGAELETAIGSLFEEFRR